MKKMRILSLSRKDKREGEREREREREREIKDLGQQQDRLICISENENISSLIQK